MNLYSLKGVKLLVSLNGGYMVKVSSSWKAHLAKLIEGWSLVMKNARPWDFFNGIDLPDRIGLFQ